MYEPQNAAHGLMVEAGRVLHLASTYVGIALLLIAIALISFEMTPNSKDFLMVAFACVALLPNHKFNNFNNFNNYKHGNKL